MYELNKSNKSRQEMISDETAKRDEGELRSLTYMLLTASFSYLILTLPYLLKILCTPYMVHFYELFDDFGSAMQLWYICSLCLMYLNNSVNFLLYCIGGETFREEFLMCGCHKRMSVREKVIEQATKEREERMNEKENKIKK